MSISRRRSAAKQRKLQRLARTTTDSDDPYLTMVYEQLDHLRRWYRLFADKQPVMLYDIQEQRIYAYPYQAFKADLSARSQATLTGQYERAIVNHQMVVFVRDNEQRRLISNSLDIA